VAPRVTRSKLTLLMPSTLFKLGLGAILVAACGGNTLGYPTITGPGNPSLGEDSDDGGVSSSCGPGLGCGGPDATTVTQDARAVSHDARPVSHDAKPGGHDVDVPRDTGEGLDAGGTGNEASAPVDAGTFDSALIDANTFDSAVSQDAAASPTEAFSLVVNGTAAHPLSCPTSHWEFPLNAGSIKLKNTGSVPLAYIAESGGWEGGVDYSPGVPTSQSGESVGVLAPGAELTLQVIQSNYDTIALIGASKPFSDDDAGFAPADEWTIPWPQGVSGSGGGTTMYVAEIGASTACSPVARP
jgi:hypothetical protein